MNADRLRTVAWAIDHADKSTPRFRYPYYALKNGEPVELADVDGDTWLDIAGWTCYEYPDLCQPQSKDPSAKREWYFWNARNILGLTTGQADRLFVTLNESYDLEYPSDVTPELAVEALNELARSVDGKQACRFAGPSREKIAKPVAEDKEKTTCNL